MRHSDISHRMRPPVRMQLATIMMMAATLSAAGVSLVLLPATARAQDSPPARAQAPAQAGPQDPRWTAIRDIFGQEGKAEEGYFRVEPPRSDLRVRIGDVTLEHPFELTTYFGFAPVGQNDVLAMGEVIMTQNEVNGALVEARRQGIHVTALHNHMLDEVPVMYWMHWYGTGEGTTLARGVAAAISRTNSERRASK